MSERLERQELHCHNCGRYVQFTLDVSMNGNHVLNCPNCDHEHCRVVKDGRITDIRWDQRNGPTIQVSQLTTTSSTSSTFTISCSGSGTTIDGAFLYSSWLNTATS